MELKDIKASVDGILDSLKGLREDTDQALEAKGEEIALAVKTTEEHAEQLEQLRSELEEAIENGEKAEELQERLDKLEAKMGRSGIPGAPMDEPQTLGELFVEKGLPSAQKATGERIMSDPVEVKSFGPYFPSSTKANLLSTEATRLVLPQRVGLEGAVERRLFVRSLLPVNSTTSNSVEFVREIGFHTGTTIAVSSLTQTGGVATADTASAHGLVVGELVQIAGADQTEYNGVFTVRSIVDADTFTYDVDSGAVSPATGTITMQQLQQHGAAGAQTEGAAKAEADMDLELRSATVRTIAHWIPASRQVLDDAPMLRSYIDSRLLYGLLIEEEEQILYGSGTAPDLQGILTDAERITHTATADPVLDVLDAFEILATLGDEPTGVVMHPAEWYTIRREREGGTVDMYIHGTPVSTSANDRRIDGVPVVVTPGINAGEIAVGNFADGAALWEREGGNIRISESHASLFVQNMLAILAEQRMALTTFRPQAFVHVA